MLLIYASLGTKNTERLAKLLPYESLDIDTVDTINLEPIGRPYVLVVPSYEHHPHYEQFADILDNDILNCKGIIGTGNRNFGNLFLVSAKELSKNYNIPIIHEIEFFGTEKDREDLIEILTYIQQEDKISDRK